MCKTIFACHAEMVRNRVRQLNDAMPADGRYVLYWAQMNRRVDSNHALAFAVELANQRQLPVLFYEGLTCSYPFANDRLHTFLLEGVPDTSARLKTLGIGYVFHLHQRHKSPNDALYRLAADAAAVVADDYPAFVVRDYNAPAPARNPAPYFVFDFLCIVPMSHFEKQEYAAYTIRPKIRKVLAEYLAPVPPLRLKRKWKPLPRTPVKKEDVAKQVANCEIDHSV